MTVSEGSGLKFRLRFLEPIAQIPPKKHKKSSIYDEIVDEFLASGLKCAQVKDIGKRAPHVCAMLNSRLQKKGIGNVKARIRNQKVYLEKANVYEAFKNKTAPKKIVEPPMINYQSWTAKPDIDVTHLLKTYIIKLRCPKCKALNAKDARFCRECKLNFYSNEEEYRHQLEQIEELERKLNPKENQAVPSND